MSIRFHYNSTISPKNQLFPIIDFCWFIQKFEISHLLFIVVFCLFSQFLLFSNFWIFTWKELFFFLSLSVYQFIDLFHGFTNRSIPSFSKCSIFTGFSDIFLDFVVRLLIYWFIDFLLIYWFIDFSQKPPVLVLEKTRIESRFRRHNLEQIWSRTWCLPPVSDNGVIREFLEKFEEFEFGILNLKMLKIQKFRKLTFFEFSFLFFWKFSEKKIVSENV